MKKLTLFVCLLPFLFACPMFGQAQYSTTASYSFIDNNSNCVSHNCFLPVPTTTVAGTSAHVSTISTGFDGFVLGLSSGDHTAWKLPAMSSATGKSVWSQWSTRQMYGVAVASESEIYSLTTADCSVAGVSNLNWYNGSTFTNIYGCLNTLSTTADGLLLGVNLSNHLLYYTTNPRTTTPTWITFAGSGWTNVVGLDATTAYGIQGQTLYVLNLTNNTYAAMSGAGPVTSLAATAEKVLFATVPTTTSKGNVWRIDLTQANPVWVNITGTLSAVFGSAMLEVFGTNNTQPSHFLAVALQGAVNIHGSYDCSSGMCPPGAVHTATATASFSDGYFAGAHTSQSGSPQTVLDATAFDVSSGCDPVFGDPFQSSCQIGSSGRVSCTVMGTLVQQTAPAASGLFSGWGVELVKNLSGAVGRNCYTSQPLGFYNQCTYTTAPSCSNLYPQYPITTVYDSSPAKAGWYVAYKCWGNSVVHACAAMPPIKTSNPGPWAGCVNPY